MRGIRGEAGVLATVAESSGRLAVKPDGTRVYVANQGRDNSQLSVIDTSNGTVIATVEVDTFARGGAPIKKTTSIGKLIQDTVGFSLRGSHSRSEFTFGADLWPAEIDPDPVLTASIRFALAMKS